MSTRIERTVELREIDASANALSSARGFAKGSPALLPIVKSKPDNAPSSAAPSPAEPTENARLLEIENTMRELLRARRAEEQRPKSSGLALLAVALAAAALLCSGTQAYHARAAYTRATESTRDFADTIPDPAPIAQDDLRTQMTIPELAKRAPSLRNGTVQAWWAGEQARQVQRLEAQAKRQALAGDREGAARSAQRADSIRGNIPVLADFEKPLSR